MGNYYSSSTFNHYRNIDNLNRVKSTIDFYDINTQIVEIEKPLTNFEIELQLQERKNNVEL
jgi:hypothetical protein